MWPQVENNPSDFIKIKTVESLYICEQILGKLRISWIALLMDKS